MKKRTFTDEIESKANLFVQRTLLDLFIKWDFKLKWYEYDKEKGIDFNFEIENREPMPKTLSMFFLQNKGMAKKATPLKSGSNKGMISFKLDRARQVQYFCSEVDQPLIITICDLESESIYWEPIQLSAEKYLSEVENIYSEVTSGGRTTDSIQIYFQPSRCLVKGGRIQYDNFEAFSKDIEESKSYVIFRNLNRALKLNQDLLEPIDIDGSLPILEQIYLYFKARFKQVATLPTELWSSFAPFKKANSLFFSYVDFNLFIDNEEMMGFFESLRIENCQTISFENVAYIQDVEDYSEKTRYILQTLNENLVFSITLYNSSKRQKDIRFTAHINCSCVQCRFNKLSFGSILASVNEGAVMDLEDLEKSAYVFYRLGLFNYSAKFYLEAARKAVASKLYFKAFVIKCNLSRLLLFLNNGLDRPDRKLLREIERETKALDVEVLKLGKLRNLGKWVFENKYFAQSNVQLTETLRNAREYYFNQLYGGRSSNSLASQAICTHAELRAFLDNNFIIFDAYREFKQYTEDFLETLTCLHAIHESMFSRISYFDDWLVSVLIFDSNADDIKEHLDRYFIKSVKYESSAIDNSKYLDLVRNLFRYDSDIIHFFQNSKWEETYHFRELYQNVFSSVLVFASYLELSPMQVNEIASLLVEFIAWNDKIINNRSIKYIAQFVNKKSSEFTRATLESYIDLLFSNRSFHDDEFLLSLADVSERLGRDKALTEDQEKKVKSFFNGQCPLCNGKHDPSSLVQYFRLFKNNYSTKFFKNLSQDLLQREYDWRLYYLSAMYGLMGINNEHFRELINIEQSDQNRARLFSHYSTDEVNRSFRLNAIINLCYKYEVNLRDNRFDHLRGFDPYYDWLMDLGGFDYSFFNPRWIKEYKTKYYFGAFRKFQIIKEKTFAYLTKHQDPQLKDCILEIYLKTNNEASDR